MDISAAPGRRIGWRWAVAATLALVALAAGVSLWLTRDKPLHDDPAGAAACKGLADWIRGDVKDPDTGKPLSSVYMAASVSKPAEASNTAGIRAAVGEDIMASTSGQLVKQYGGPGSLRFTDLPKLRDACASAGVKMPAYAEP